MLFIVPDTHFRHAKLIVCGARPPDFESRLMAAWRETVAPADDVIVLGDIGFGDCGDIFRALPGRKILIRGNHDHGSDAKFRAMSFSLVCDSLTVRMRGRRVLLTHCPMYEHGYDINVHGHLHSLFTYPGPGPGLRLPLALEASDFAPIAAGEHFEKMVESFCRRFEEQDIRPAAADFAALHRSGRKKPSRMTPEGFYASRKTRPRSKPAAPASAAKKNSWPCSAGVRAGCLTRPGHSFTAPPRIPQPTRRRGTG